MAVTIIGTPVAPNGYYTETAVITQTVTATTGQFVGFMSVVPGMIVNSVALVVGAGTASSTAAIGDTANNTSFNARYLAATSTASAGYFTGAVVTALTTGVISAGPGYQYLTNDTIGVTVAGATVTAVVYVLIVSYTRAYQ